MNDRVSQDEINRLKRESSERTSVLANERTYAAWVRTGLTALATGLAIEKFLGGVVPDWSIRINSCILIAFSGICFFLAAWRYQHVGVRMSSQHVTGAPTGLLIIISVFLVLAAFIALMGVFVKNLGFL